MQGDAVYFRRRALEQSEAAMNADHPKARASHLELARRYEEFANALAAHERKNGGRSNHSAS